MGRASVTPTGMLTLGRWLLVLVGFVVGLFIGRSLWGCL